MVPSSRPTPSARTKCGACLDDDKAYEQASLLGPFGRSQTSAPGAPTPGPRSLRPAERSLNPRRPFQPASPKREPPVLLRGRASAHPVALEMPATCCNRIPKIPIALPSPIRLLCQHELSPCRLPPRHLHGSRLRQAPPRPLIPRKSGIVSLRIPASSPHPYQPWIPPRSAAGIPASSRCAGGICSGACPCSGFSSGSSCISCR